MKKIVALALTVVMVLGLLAGCEKPMDAKTLTQKMDEAMKDTTAMAAKMDMEMEFTIGVSGMTMTMGMDMVMDVKGNMDTGAAYADMEVSVEALGQSEAVEMEMYAATEDDKMVSYVYESTTDSWTKSETAGMFESLEQFQGAGTTYAEFPEEGMTLAKEKETVNGKECYVLTVEMDGTYFQDAMTASMEAAMAELDEESKAILESIDWSKLSATMVYHVDAETFEAVQLSGELLGMGDVMNSMFAGVMGEMMGMDGAEMELTVDVPTCKFSMTDVVYNDVEIPTVPQEAIDAAALNPLQSDGSYILRSGEDAVRIVVPEGYEAMVMDSQTLAVYSEDYTVSAMYAYAPDMTGEDLKASFEEEIAAYQEDEEYYVSHAYGEFNGFTTVILRLSDGSAIYYAWKDTTGDAFCVSVNAMAPMDTPDVFLECISEVEG